MKLKLIILLFCSFIIGIKSQVGLHTDTPKGTLHIVGGGSLEELLILQDVKDANTATESYLDLKISEAGVVRYAPPASPNQSAIIDLAAPLSVPATAASAVNFTWILADGTNTQFITLPEDGAYIFSFRLYGGVTTANSGSLYVISSWKDGDTTPLNTNALYLIARGASVGTTVTTQTYNVTVSGSKGDKIYFTIYRDTSSITSNIGLTLRAVPGNNANKTSLLYWRIK